MTGYLKAVTNDQPFGGDYMCEVALPNKEISYVYNKEILSKFENMIPPATAIAIQEAIYDDDYLDEVDECLSLPPQEAEPKKPVRLEAPRQPSAHITPNSAASIPSGPVKIPEFLKKDSGRPELDKVLAKKEESFSEMLLRLIDEKGLKDSDVYKSANIDRRLFSKIRGDEDYVPSKKTAISFCLALQLDMDASKKLLATAGYTLSASSRFDLIIMYLIEKCEYNIHFANIVLDDYGEGTLSR